MELHANLPFSSEPNGPTNAGAYDLQSVTTHEFGHGLGMDHNLGEGTNEGGYPISMQFPVAQARRGNTRKMTSQSCVTIRIRERLARKSPV